MGILKARGSERRRASLAATAGELAHAMLNIAIWRGGTLRPPRTPLPPLRRQAAPSSASPPAAALRAGVHGGSSRGPPAGSVQAQAVGRRAALGHRQAPRRHGYAGWGCAVIASDGDRRQWNGPGADPGWRSRRTRSWASMKARLWLAVARVGECPRPRLSSNFGSPDARTSHARCLCTELMGQAIEDRT